jgi:hypothetical protein
VDSCGLQAGDGHEMGGHVGGGVRFRVAKVVEYVSSRTQRYNTVLLPYMPL